MKLATSCTMQYNRGNTPGDSTVQGSSFTTVVLVQEGLPYQNNGIPHTPNDTDTLRSIRELLRFFEAQTITKSQRTELCRLAELPDAVNLTWKERMLLLQVEYEQEAVNEIEMERHLHLLAYIANLCKANIADLGNGTVKIDPRTRKYLPEHERYERQKPPSLIPRNEDDE